MPEKLKLRSYIQKELFYKSVVEDGSDIIFIVDYNGIILYHNPAVNHILGYPFNSLINESFYSYLSPDDINLFKTKFIA